MSRKTLKVAPAGALVACGGFATGIAWATPGQGITATILAGPVTLDPSTSGARAETRRSTSRPRASRTCILQQDRAGGHTGWHSHPGPVFVMITAGTMTKYVAGDPTPAIYPAGTGFVEDGGVVHVAGNAGDVDLQFVAFHLIPKGGAVRIDEPQP